MAKADLVMEVEIRVSWWVPVYLQTLGFFCGVMGTAPDMRKVVRTVVGGTRIKIGNRWHRLRALTS